MHKIQPKTLFIGKNIIYLPSCHSTNDIAAEKIQIGEAKEGTIVITEDQFAGKGQRGSLWESMPGQNITMTLVLEPKFLQISKQFSLTVAISLAIYAFLEEFSPKGLSIKWPNDLYIQDRKLGGVLIENSISGHKILHSLVGIGLNINQLEFNNPKPISLRMATQSPEYILEELVARLCEHLEAQYLWLKSGHGDIQQKKYLERLYRFKEWHDFQEEEKKIKAKIVDITQNGELVVQTETEKKTYNLKEITFL